MEEWKAKKINFQDYEKAVGFLMDENIMFPLILNGYRYIAKNNINLLNIIEISWGAAEVITISISTSDSEDTLDKLINWLEKEERYEECIEMSTLKNQLKGTM